MIDAKIKKHLEYAKICYTESLHRYKLDMAGRPASSPIEMSKDQKILKDYERNLAEINNLLQTG